MKIEDYAHDIGALVPYYDERGGNATRLYTLSGETVEDTRTIRWILKRLARLFAVDLDSLRHHYGAYLGISKGVPLPLREELVLVPLKLRQIIGEHDGAGGYVNVVAVQRVEDFTGQDGAKSRIILKSGQAVPCHFSRKTVEQRLKAGEIAKERYRFIQGPYALLKTSPAKESEPNFSPEMLKQFIDFIFHSFYRYF